MTVPNATGTAEAAKAYWRVNHNQTARLPPREEQPHRWALAEHIAALAPAPSWILEFGCSSGRNLAVLHRNLPDAVLVGIDMNPTTIQAGRNTHPFITFIEGDEGYLPKLRAGGFDVVFTCSVLDHIPHPEWQVVYDELVRIAGRHVVLLEPMLSTDDIFHRQNTGNMGLREKPLHGDEPIPLAELQDAGLLPHGDWVERDFADLGISAAPFSYAHDYPGHDPHLRIVRPLPIPAPMWPEFGNTYHLMQRDKEANHDRG